MSPPARSEEETGTDEREGELAAFEGYSDAELVHAAGKSPLHLIALHQRYRGLVGQLAVQRSLSQQVWLSAFETLERDPHSLLPVADRLTQVVQTVLEEDHIAGERTSLPDPLAWYLRGVLENLPQPLRVVLMLVEVERRLPEELATFFAVHQLTITASEAMEHYARAQALLVEGLPPEVRRFYFDGALDCLSLMPWLYPQMADEIRRFEVWQQAQSNATPPGPQPAFASRLWWAAPILLGFVVGGFVWQSRQDTLSPPPPTEAPVLPRSAATPTPQKVNAPPTPVWSGRTYLLVAAPDLEGFTRLRTIDRNIYYRPYRGRPHVQIGVYATRSSAEVTGRQVSRLGFEPIFAPATAP